MGSAVSLHCVTALVFICWSLVSFTFPTGTVASLQVFVFYSLTEELGGVMALQCFGGGLSCTGCDQRAEGMATKSLVQMQVKHMDTCAESTKVEGDVCKGTLVGLFLFLHARRRIKGPAFCHLWFKLL